MSFEKSSDLIGNLTDDLQACSIVPQPTTQRHAPQITCSNPLQHSGASCKVTWGFAPRTFQLFNIHPSFLYNLSYRPIASSSHKQINLELSAHRTHHLTHLTELGHILTAIQCITSFHTKSFLQLQKKNYVHNVTKQKVPFMAATVLRSRDVPFPIGQLPVVPLSLWSAWTRPSACSQTSRKKHYGTFTNSRVINEISGSDISATSYLNILSSNPLKLNGYYMYRFNIQKHCFLHTECF
jgi:hypothetical protein